MSPLRISCKTIKKVLGLNDQTAIEDISKTLGAAALSLYRWVDEAKNQQLDTALLDDQPLSIRTIPLEKRPCDWSRVEKMAPIIRCGPLHEKHVNTLCSEQGIYPHDVAQWKNGFLTASNQKESTAYRYYYCTRNFDGLGCC
jgi:hypothetical protein